MEPNHSISPIVNFILQSPSKKFQIAQNLNSFNFYIFLLLSLEWDFYLVFKWKKIRILGLDKLESLDEINLMVCAMSRDN